LGNLFLRVNHVKIFLPHAGMFLAAHANNGACSSPLRTKGSAHSRHELQARASGEKPQIYT
jgi:hypothetical protein